MVDEQSLSDPGVGQPVPPSSSCRCTDPVPVIRAKDDVVVVAGSGDGVIDAAAAGVLDGRELLRYAASLSEDELAEALRTARRVIVTDSNRDRAHHWRGSQDVWGFTESGSDGHRPSSIPTTATSACPCSPARPTGAAQTVALQEGPVRATASAYGEPFAYRPEDRAVHGHRRRPGHRVAWWPIGRRPRASASASRSTSRSTTSPCTSPSAPPRSATSARSPSPSTTEAPQRVELDERSLGDGPAHRPRTDHRAVDGHHHHRLGASSPTRPPDRRRPPSASRRSTSASVPRSRSSGCPTDVTTALAGGQGGRSPLTFVLTRLRTRPDRPLALRPRAGHGPRDRGAGGPDVHAEDQVRLDQRAADAVLADLLGITGGRGRRPSDRRRHGGRVVGHRRRPDHGLDHAVRPGGRRSTLRATATGPARRARRSRSGAGDFSPVTGLRLTAGGDGRRRRRPSAGRHRAEPHRAARPLPAGPVADRDHRHRAPHHDRPPLRRARRPAGGDRRAVRRSRHRDPRRLDSGCRDDLVRSTASPSRCGSRRATGAAAGRGGRAPPSPATTPRSPSTPAPTVIDRTRCADRPPGRPHRARVPGPVAGADPARPHGHGHRRPDGLGRTVTVDGCPDGCWLVLGEGFHESWSARAGRERPRSAGHGRRRLQRLVDPARRRADRRDRPSGRRRRRSRSPSSLSVIAVVACVVLSPSSTADGDAGTARTARPASSSPAGGRPARRWWPRARSGSWPPACSWARRGRWWPRSRRPSFSALLRRPRLAGLVTLGALAFIAVAIMRGPAYGQPARQRRPGRPASTGSTASGCSPPCRCCRAAGWPGARSTHRQSPRRRQP